ncbi:GH3 domain-containing protein-like [Babylonia areolata]|uniref:GH3 domain-containing protein-like n=1 Tax=Babylonia areolata TaxID=304850 RepID=UPI003FD3FC1C
MDILTFIVCVTAFVTTALALLLTWDIRAKRVQSQQTVLQAVRHYVGVRSLQVMGLFFRRKLMSATRHVEDTQAAFLMGVLHENASTKYGGEKGFEKMKTYEDFRSGQPLTRYEDYADYVQRMMDGEKMVLTRQQPVIFGVSSGTSGNSKIIPMLKKQQTMFFLHVVSVFYGCLLEAFPQVSSKLKKTLKIFFNPRWRTSKSGIRIGPNSSTPASQKNILHMYSTPAAAFDILSEPDAVYVHLLFALKDRHLGMIEGNFASLIYNAMVTLNRSLQQLLHDIRQGTLNADLNIPADIRVELEKLLQPDPTRAEEIQRAFDGGVTGVCRRIWPELELILTVDSGAFAPYADRLRSTFCRGVPIYSAVYAATEGLTGINLWPGQQPSRYLPHPALQFLEFIPVDSCHLDQPRTLLLHQLKEGEEYEVVLTNVSGLYRYRVGDVVKVTGFCNQCPIFEFQYRIGQFLNVRGEKTSESLFYETLCETVAQWSGVTLVDYCCAESVLVDDTDFRRPTESESYAPCYHVFLEVETEDGLALLSEDQKRMIDERMCAKSYVYSSFRVKGSIDVMKVHILRHGAFQDLRQYALQNTEASSNQFKVPRVLKRRSLVEFLLKKEL